MAADAGAGRSLDETPLSSIVHFLPPLAHQVAHTTEVVVMVELLSRHMEDTTQDRAAVLFVDACKKEKKRKTHWPTVLNDPSLSLELSVDLSLLIQNHFQNKRLALVQSCSPASTV